MGTVEPQVASGQDVKVVSSGQIVANAQSQDVTDGFHLVIDALKLNGIDTIFGLPGIPITDFTRIAQAEGMRVISFRHEQNAGNAAAIAGFMTQKPGICLTVSAPGFLNGLTALANATTNCFPMILISGSSEREIVDLQQGDYEEMDQLAIARPLCKAAFRVLHAEDIGLGIARAITGCARTARARPGAARSTRRGAARSSSRSTSRRRRWTATCASTRPWSATSVPACRRCSRRLTQLRARAGPSRRRSGWARSPSARTRTSRSWRRPSPRIRRR